MCGIFGIVADDPNRVFDRACATDALEAIEHRGPDDAGVFVSPGVLLGNRRLAILDLSPAGHMPMCTADGRYSITYNGEIYNFKELRSGLEAKGYSFRSDCDTEVLLNMFVEYGHAMLTGLNGMFSFAIWDAKDRRLFAARDRVGVKPFYYARHGESIYFGSEQKALFRAGVPLEFSGDVWEELLCFRYVAGPKTVFTGVERLLPGHWLTFHAGRLDTQPWWRLEDRAREWRESLPKDIAGWFGEQFRSSVDMRRISDVPVGVLLSGGLDSSSIAACLGSRTGSGLASFTVSFAELEYDESSYAKLVAVRWALDYHELSVSPDKITKTLDEAAWFNDEPLSHGNDLHMLAIARSAKPSATVLLSGEGADETLGGYVRYRPLQFPRMLSALRPFMPALRNLAPVQSRFSKLGRFLELESLEKFLLFNACDVLPAQLSALGMTVKSEFPYRQSLLDRSRSLYGPDLIRRAMFMDQHSFMCSLLDRNDRMTMGASIECRVPFLDYRLVEILAALPSSVLIDMQRTKSLLRDTMSASLPRSVRHHRKWGFGVPWHRYLRDVPELRERVMALPESPVIANSPLDTGKLRALISRYLAGSHEDEALVKQLVMLASWQSSYAERLATPRQASNPRWADLQSVSG
jgi:asparagine synthase (glutamine-hydrolysing)